MAGSGHADVVAAGRAVAVDEETRLGRGGSRMLTTAFAASGAAGLVVQVSFSKYLSYLLGSTAYAVSAVLAAFMTGLSLGAHAGGRLSARGQRPLVAYGVAELTVAAAVFAAPAAFGLLAPLYAVAARSADASLPALSVLRWSTALVLVLIPTTAMGATLPLVAPALGAGAQRGRRLGALYAANTCGGALGALTAAYAILPALGIRRTLYAAGATCAAAGTAALLFGRRIRADRDALSPDARTSRSPPPTEVGAHGDATLAALAFLSGLLVFATEVTGTHLLAVIIGNSAYAFGLILAIFLLCLFAGAALAHRVRRRFGSAAIPVSLGAAALAVGGTLPFWDALPAVFGGLGHHLTSFAAREAVRGVVALVILVLPATLMGLTFPLLLQEVAARREVGRLVGRLTAINTLGSVAGALLTGYVVLPAFGSQRSLALVAALLATAAFWTSLPEWRRPKVQGQPGRRRLAVGLGAAGLLAASLCPAWDPARLTAGSNVYFEAPAPPDAMLMVREDIHGGITTVTLRDGVRTLYTNGKFQGNDGWELDAQRYFAHYPSLFVPRFEKALVIGLGTGTTLGTFAAYPWMRIDVVELSPAIVEAAREHFSVPNRGALHDPRVRLHLEDGRSFLLLDRDRYDLISMELSSVWFAGASNLYSREFYALARERLAPGGIFQQWVQLHHIERPVFATLLNTLRLAFEHVALFYGGGQGVVVASRAPLRWSPDRALAFQEQPVIRQTVPAGRMLTALAGDVLVLEKGLDRFLADSARQVGASLETMVSTDDNLFLEYASPRGNVLSWQARDELVATLLGYRDAEAIEKLATGPI